MNEVNQFMQNSDTQISIESVLRIAIQLTVNLEAYRALMEQKTGFSDEWIEAACMRMFNTCFRNGS